MRLRALWMAVALATAIPLSGCDSAKEESEGPPKPKTVVFQGQIDSKFVGSWKSSDGRARLDLAKDGALKIGSTIATPQGDSKSEISGHWLVDNGDLILKYLSPGQPDTVIKYQVTLAGNTLACKQSGGQLKVVYVRK